MNIIGYTGIFMFQYDYMLDISTSNYTGSYPNVGIGFVISVQTQY